MILKHLGYILLPLHLQPSTEPFDHAAVSEKTGDVFIAHTANDTLDIIDGNHEKVIASVPNLKGIAGALTSDERDLVFTSNRNEDTVALIDQKNPKNVEKIKVGKGPNGLAFDSKSGLLLVGNTGTPPSISIVDVAKKKMIADLKVPDRTRWAIFDPSTDNFYVNVKSPSEIVVISAKDPSHISKTFTVPEKGPHGLDLDVKTHRLFCACDSGKLVVLNQNDGKVLGRYDLSGSPDVIFFNRERRHLYATIENPGVLDVFDTDTMNRLEGQKTEKGVHTFAMSQRSNKLYLLYPETHRAAVLSDEKVQSR